ncbi:MAG: thiamine pyrophosphate-dependent enzyme [Candidatus Woesearchaeota archaeon]
MASKKTTKKSVKDPYPKPDHENWCPGCGNYGIFTAINDAIKILKLKEHELLFTYGIGCHGHMVNFHNRNGFEGLHGRAIPVAVGAKLANHKLNTIVISGDGDCMGEGLNHFVHAARGNQDITVILHDNRIYGLTTGQTSPTSQKGFRTKSTPFGVIEKPVNPLMIALSAGATFVARGFAANLKQLSELIQKGVKHKGFSLIDICQPCVSFNHHNTYEWFNKHTYNLDDISYDPSDKLKAIDKAKDEEKLGLGVFYEEKIKSYQEEVPQLSKNILANTSTQSPSLKYLMDVLR